MYKNILQGIDHIAIWPVVSFVIFFLFFICLIWWVATVDNKYVDTMKELPIDQQPGTIQSPQSSKS
jgi:cytochrome c oxidase cbb3-type subunit IV